MTKTKITPETKSEVAAIIGDLVLIKPLNDVVINSGLEKSKAEKYALGYAQLMREVVEQSDLLKPLDKTNPDDAAKAKRISLDLGKICSRLSAKKKDDKDTLLIETRLIDGLFNVAESTARLTQKDADEIVDYLAGIERERLAKLADSRRDELQKYDVDTTYLPLEIMGDEQYQRCLNDAILLFNTKVAAAEKLEAERLEQLRLAELAEIERLRLQAERIEAERLEAIRVREELAAKEAQLVKERDIAAKQRDEHNRAAEVQRKLAAAEADKLAKENANKLADQKRLADIEAKKQADEYQKKLDTEAVLHRKKIAENEKLATELQAKKDAESKIEADKKAAQLAPDKEKINQLYTALKTLEIPDFTSIECQMLGTDVLNKISHILSYIKAESAKLK